MAPPRPLGNGLLALFENEAGSLSETSYLRGLGIPASTLAAPAKTLLFSADTAHGADLCQGFQAAGFDFRQSTYRDSNEVTTAMVEGFRRGDFTGFGVRSEVRERLRRARRTGRRVLIAAWLFIIAATVLQHGCSSYRMHYWGAVAKR